MEETLYEDEGISISELIGIVLKHFKLLLIVFGIIVLVCVGYILMNDPTYTATTTVSVDSIKNLTAWNTARGDIRNITTELQFLTRDETVRGALGQLNLASYIRKDGSTYEDMLTDKKKFKCLQESIATSEIKDTNSVSISLEHANPGFAQDFLGALTNEFSASLLAFANTDLTLQREALNRQWEESTTLLESSKAALATFQEETDILSLEANKSAYQRILSLIQLQLGEVAGIAPATSLEVALKSLGLQDEQVLLLSSRYSDAYRQYLYDEIARLLVQSNTSEENIVRNPELELVLTDLEAQFSELFLSQGFEELTALERTRSITSSIEFAILSSLESEYLNKLKTVTNLQLEYSELRNDVSRETSTSVSLTSQIRSLESFLTSERTAMQEVEPVKLVNEDGESNNLLILAVGVLLGAALALLATLLAEYLSDTIDDEQSLTRILGKEGKLLTTIPPGSKDINTEMEILEHPDSAAGSAYTHLAGIMMYAPNTNVFTLGSLSYGQGTSYTTLNTALSMVKSGKKVLVIGTANEGMNYQRLYAKITSHVEIASAAHLKTFSLDKPCKPTGEDPELIITSMDAGPNELGQILNSPQFVEYLGSVSALFDVVLIDGPTFRSASNLLAVSRATNGLILNIRSFVGSRRMLKALLHTFGLCNLPLSGVILNNIAGKPSYQERQAIQVHDKALTSLMSGNGGRREAKLLTKAASR
nr:Wzz/FepE/Etk N-terminal domain-containing protein [uncultured Sphaerochaeta sp.]